MVEDGPKDGSYPGEVVGIGVAVLPLATLLIDSDMDVSHARFQAPAGEIQVLG